MTKSALSAYQTLPRLNGEICLTVFVRCRSEPKLIVAALGTIVSFSLVSQNHENTTVCFAKDLCPRIFRNFAFRPRFSKIDR